MFTILFNIGSLTRGGPFGDGLREEIDKLTYSTSLEEPKGRHVLCRHEFDGWFDISAENGNSVELDHRSGQGGKATSMDGGLSWPRIGKTTPLWCNV